MEFLNTRTYFMTHNVIYFSSEISAKFRLAKLRRLQLAESMRPGMFVILYEKALLVILSSWNFFLGFFNNFCLWKSRLLIFIHFKSKALKKEKWFGSEKKLMKNPLKKSWKIPYICSKPLVFQIILLCIFI